MKIVHLLSALCVIGVTSAAGAEKPKSNVPITSRQQINTKRTALISAAKETMVKKLKDPESVRFRNMIVSPKLTAVCGELNAKNGLGGYVGFERFIVTDEKTSVQGDGTYVVETRWVELCEYDDRAEGS